MNMNIQHGIKVAIAVLGSTIIQQLGGWDTALQTLLFFMAADYLTGVIVAGIFKKSRKTDGGGLKSDVGIKGLFRKGGILLVVMIGTRLDMLVGTGELVRDAAIFGFLANEVISLTENLGLMGVPLPSTISQAIEILKKKGEGKIESRN